MITSDAKRQFMFIGPDMDNKQKLIKHWVYLTIDTRVWFVFYLMKALCGLP